MANYQNLKAAISAAIRTNGNQEITGQVLQDVLNSIVSVIGANYTFAGVATPATNPGTPDQNVMYLAMDGGTYTNFNGTVLPAGISLLMWNGTWTSETVMYGDGGVFDISVYKSSGGTLATYADLSAALDGGNNIPASARKGGMSVKYVQTSDNKYVQYRLTADEWSTNTEDWAVAVEGVYVENPEFIYVKTDAEGKILWAIKTDGGIYYGAGVPQQVKDYIEDKISSLSLDEYEDIVAFLSDYLGSDTTLKVIIDGINASLEDKLDAEGLDPEALGTAQAVENQEYIQVTTDSEDKILEAITSEGVKQINIPIETPSATIEHVKNPEWLSVTTDADGKILEGITNDGQKYTAGFNTQEQSAEIVHNIFNNLVSDKPDNNSGWICENGEYGGDNVKYTIPVKPNNKTRVVFKFRYNAELTSNNVAHICSIGDHSLGLINNGVLISRGYIGKKTIFRAYHNDAVVGEQDMSDYSFQPHNGQTAFYVRYTGTYDGNSVIKLVWTSSTISLTKNGVVSESVNYSENDSVYALTQALDALNEIEVRVICCTTRKVSEILHYDGMEIPMTAEYIGIRTAFSISYTGSTSPISLTVATSGSSKVVTIGSLGSLTFNDSDSMESVISAIDGLSNELDAKAYFTRGRTFADLGWNDNTVINIYKNRENMVEYVDSLPYYDAMPICIPYAVDEKWHTVEMVCDNIAGYCAASLDGQTIYSASNTEFSNVQIGGSYGSGVSPITCRDLEIDVDNVGDAEVISINDRKNGVIIKQLISSYNPRVLIWEGHIIDTLLEDGMEKDAEGKTTDGELSEGIDRLNLIFGKCEAGGYMPISLRQMVDWKINNTPLPSKRCYLCIFDDWPARYYVDFDIRGAFNKHNVKPNFAMIWTPIPTSFMPYTMNIPINGHEYTMQEVVDIVKANGGGICSHVNHQLIGRIIPSELWNFLKESTYNAEKLGLTAEVLVYPGGKFTETSHEILENSMFNIGVDVSFYNYNCRATNRFSFKRYGIDRQAHANTEFDDLIQ